MRIDPKSHIGGAPAIKVRDFLRRNSSGWHVDRLAARLKLSPAAARTVVDALLALSYIEPLSDYPDEYVNTLNGGAFASATAARPLTRRAADRELGELLDRIRAVNGNSEYLFWVPRAIVFGSYLSDQQRISDVDVAIELVQKIPPGKQFHEAALARASRAAKEGRRFGSLIDRLCWCQDEVLLFLQNRSRAIALVLADNPILEHATEKRVHEFHTMGGIGVE